MGGWQIAWIQSRKKKDGDQEKDGAYFARSGDLILGFHGFLLNWASCSDRFAMPGFDDRCGTTIEGGVDESVLTSIPPPYKHCNIEQSHCVAFLPCISRNKTAGSLPGCTGIHPYLIYTRKYASSMTC